MTTSKSHSLRSMLADRAFLKVLVSLTLPMVAQNLISLATQMMDSVMLGAVGQTQLSASSLANQPFFMFSMLCFGLAGGGAVLITQYYGKKDMNCLGFAMIWFVYRMTYSYNKYKYTRDKKEIRASVFYCIFFILTTIVFFKQTL